jgi:hypothetical protein
MPERAARFESAALSAKRPLLVAALAAGILVAAILGVHIMYTAALPDLSALPPREFPTPRVETGSPEALRALEAEQRRRLEGYRWIDRGAGIVAVPIERAMAIEAARGEAAYDPVTTAPAAPAPDEAGAAP